MKHLLTLCIGFFMLLSCNNKPSQSAAIATDEPEVNEDTLFRVIDLANNLKPCGDSLLLSDIVEDVEYVKLEAAEKGLVGAMNRGYVSDSAIFYSSSGNTTPPPHIFMFDRFTGKFIRTIGKSGQGPGEMHWPIGVVARDSLVYISSTYRNELFVHKIKNGEFVKCIPLNKPHTAAENYYIVNNRIIHFPFYDVWDGKYLMCDMSIQDFDGNIIQKQTPDVDYTGFDDRNRPNTGFAVAWAYKNHPNVYSFFTDTIYAAFDDTIRPRYFLSLGKYKRPLQLKVSAEWKNYIIFHRFWETKDCLLGSFGLEQKAWFFRYDKKSKEIKTWKQDAEGLKASFPIPPAYEWIIGSAAGIINDIDGCSDHLRKMDYISENQFAICITQDNRDEIRKIVSESTNVKFPDQTDVFCQTGSAETPRGSYFHAPGCGQAAFPCAAPWGSAFGRKTLCGGNRRPEACHRHVAGQSAYNV